MQHNPYAQRAYKTTTMQTISAGEQVARLLETAAKHIMKAREHAEKKEFEARYLATEDAMKIITGLQSCLCETVDTQSVVETLHNYYNGIGILTTKINVKNDLGACDEVIASLRTMATTWREIEKRSRAVSDALQQTTPAQHAEQRIDIAAC